jgi:hypothetical protein
MIEIQPAPGNMIRTDGRTLKAETRLRFPMVLVASHVRPCSRTAKASSCSASSAIAEGCTKAAIRA